MSKEEFENIVKTVIRTRYPDSIPSEKDVEIIVSRYRDVCGITDEDFKIAIQNIHSDILISVEIGTSVVDDNTYEPWVKNRKSTEEMYYWNRYAAYLQYDLSWNSKLISTLNIDSDEILDLIGDPKKDKHWQRRGLILGDVQSGKTANYTAICNKAADFGFKVIILMTGTIESLRQQTQERLDAGFVGRSSQDALSKTSEIRVKGVGNYSGNNKKFPTSFTSVKRDFNHNVLMNLNWSISNATGTVLFVVKKNKAILENLHDWLKAYNTDSSGKIDYPLLLLDDEADNASVNTKSDDITAINKSIRNLLKLFTKAAYVGITATPFANIFIDPSSNDEMVGEDLFPRDFIYLLKPPSNYVGPDKVFGEEPLNENMIKIIIETEMGDLFRGKAKSLEIIEELPDSLKEAVAYYLLSNIIRNQRRQISKHKSMLINVSHYTNVQNQVFDLANEWMLNIQKDIRLYSKLPEEEALNYSVIHFFRAVFDKYDLEEKIDWETIQHNLEKEVISCEIKKINQSSQSRLDYGSYKSGANIIAIGGNSLSRGLTLEGLCVSYFYRSSKMYDTLMQMARWFGYRDGYVDLVKIWMTKDMKNWYSFVTNASNELKEDVIIMNQWGSKPEHFGLQVRAHPDSLLITARNKMKYTGKIERSVSVSGHIIETAHFSMRSIDIDTNKRCIESLLKNIEPFISFDGKNRIWKNVPRDLIIEVLNSYANHPLDIKLNKIGLIDFIEKSENLKYWDVSIPEGKKDKIKTYNVEHIPLERESDKYNSKTLRIGGSRARVRPKGFSSRGLDSIEVSRIINEFREKRPDKPNISVPDEKFLIPGRNPLLMLYFIRPEINGEILDQIYYGLGLAFPRSSTPCEDITNDKSKIIYVLNAVKLREEGLYDFEEEEEDDE
ncbi:Z1 domain-containing protein [Methanolapillus ohkumae]|uniref:Putative endonuclease Z1 domain-containing protein n=1 Tax=Methanolapillus ohkumae TaxID=3028298 RepID=A0AA97A5M1_9EURY|nr:hypothetical protein MsAm2_03900 [Methanosarcinaceae archaeon Am2]